MIMIYASPSGIYGIELEEQSRVTHFENGVGIWEAYTQYNIYLDGRLVRFVFDEDDIENAIYEFENGHGIDPIYLTGLTSG